MTNTYDMLLNPPAKKPHQSENKKIDVDVQGNQQVSKPARKTNKLIHRQVMPVWRDNKAQIDFFDTVTVQLYQAIAIL